MSVRVVVAPDKFAGSLTAAEAARHIGAGLLEYDDRLLVDGIPVADGGDGTVDALLAAGFSPVQVQVSGPTGRPVAATLAVRGDTAVVELAQASGLRQLPDGVREPMLATSRGTGQMVLAALDRGCRRIVLGVGGSACTDGGSGMLAALGAELRDASGRVLGPGGGALADCRSLELSGLDPRLRRTTLVLASDVDNPLLGEAGAARVFGPQKGADPAQIGRLEAALAHWAGLVAAATGLDRATVAGAGAAGGVGFAALSVLGARHRLGAEHVLELLDFDRRIAGASLVITGEGSLDRQTLGGKAPFGVARAAAERRIPVIAVAGRCELSAMQLRAAGLDAAYPLTLLEPDPAVSMRDAGPLLERLVSTVVAPAQAAVLAAR